MKTDVLLRMIGCSIVIYLLVKSVPSAVPLFEHLLNGLGHELPMCPQPVCSVTEILGQEWVCFINHPNCLP